MRCIKCTLTDNIEDVTLGKDGVCNFCNIYKKLCKEYPGGVEGMLDLQFMADKIKRKQRKSKYDVVIGYSGGCDSSYLIHIAHLLGLRILAVHYNNGWNSDIAEENMKNLKKFIPFDSIRWTFKKEYVDDVNRAFLLSGSQDCDISYDMAATTVLYKIANMHNVKFILNGHNFRTEGICPLSWCYMDARYVKDVHNKYGDIPNATKNMPNLWLHKWLYWIIIKRIKHLRPLYNIDLKKEVMKEVLLDLYDFQWYGGHHLDNRYTAFLSNVIFPHKFNTDRRIIELAAFVRSGNITRNEALKELKKEIPINTELVDEVERELQIDVKLLLNNSINKPTTHYDFKSYHKIFQTFKWFFWILSVFKLVPWSFYIKYCSRRRK
jgi:3'-phosphoadenosine 5'-phosphosulfate sulfotransferase (PAPS reductase)/FAD synthetase